MGKLLRSQKVSLPFLFSKTLSVKLERQCKQNFLGTEQVVLIKNETEVWEGNAVHLAGLVQKFFIKEFRTKPRH